jgi:hypothetical protein
MNARELIEQVMGGADASDVAASTLHEGEGSPIGMGIEAAKGAIEAGNLSRNGDEVQAWLLHNYPHIGAAHIGYIMDELRNCDIINEGVDPMAYELTELAEGSWGLARDGVVLSNRFASREAGLCFMGLTEEDLLEAASAINRVADMEALTGPLTVTDKGEENTYFKDGKGKSYFWKDGDFSGAELKKLRGYLSTSEATGDDYNKGSAGAKDKGDEDDSKNEAVLVRTTSMLEAKGVGQETQEVQVLLPEGTVGTLEETSGEDSSEAILLVTECAEDHGLEGVAVRVPRASLSLVEAADGYTLVPGSGGYTWIHKDGVKVGSIERDAHGAYRASFKGPQGHLRWEHTPDNERAMGDTARQALGNLIKAAARG